MECDICSRATTTKLPFFCVTCARNYLYESRLQAAKVCIQNENLRQQVVVAQGPKDDVQKPGNSDAKDLELRQSWSNLAKQVEKAQVERRKDSVLSHIASLKEEIKKAGDEMKQRNADLARRRENINIIKPSIPEGRKAVMDKIQETTKKGTQAWATIHNRTLETRAFLCREAATLYRLRQKKKARAGTVTDQYHIGGIQIFDLKEINSKWVWSPPNQHRF